MTIQPLFLMVLPDTSEVNKTKYLVKSDSLSQKKADSLFQLAQNFQKQKKYTSAFSNFDLAIPIYIRLKQNDRVVNCITLKEVAAKYQFKPFNQLEKYLRPGLAYVHREDVDDFTKAYYYNELGNALGEQKKLGDAAFYIEKGLNIVKHRSNFKPEQMHVARMVIGTSAGIEINRHNYQQAEKQLRYNIDFFTKHGVNTTFSFNRLLETYATSGQNTKFESLLVEMRDSGIMEQESYYNRYFHFYTIAHHYIKSKQYKEALKAVNNLKEIVESSGFAKHYGAWYIERFLVQIYLESGQYQMAIDILDQMNTSDDPQKIQIGNVAEDLLSKAKAYLAINQRITSFEIIERALKLLLPEHRKTEKSLALYTYDELPNKLVLADILSFKAHLLHGIYKKNSDKQYLRASLHNFEQAHFMLTRLGDVSTEDQFLTQEYFKSFYEVALLAFHNEWAKSSDYDIFYRAMQLSDESRYVTVINELRNSKSLQLASKIPTDLRQKELSIHTKLDSVRKISSVEGNQAFRESLLSDLEAIKSQLREHHPKYYEIKYGIGNKVKKVIENSYPSDNVIEYFWGNDYLFVFQVQKNNLRFDKIPITKKLNRNVRTLVQSVRNISTEEIKTVGNHIYKTIFKDYLDPNMDNILVVDDVLHFIPVASLWEDGGNSGHFLVEKFRTHRLNSISQSMTTVNSRNIGSLLLAPFASYNGTNYQKISNTKKEVESIQELMESNIYLDSNATKKRFLENSNEFSIIHLATHSLVEQENPLKSRILFYDDSTLEPSEKSLTIEELYNLDLKAELVVLSACETGIGKDVKGKGITSVSNGFNYAGASSVLMSLWKVPDKQTTIIMVSFYKYLKEGHSKNKALQKAKQDYLMSTDDELLKHPYYWAGFVISGNIEPIVDPVSYWWWLLLLPAVAIVWGYKKRKKSV